MSESALPVWRSMLFLPAHVEKFVAKAHTRGADACILDLEDSVPQSEKTIARSMIAAAALQISRHGVGVLVRVNNDAETDPAAPLLTADITEAVRPGVSALVIPKVNDAALLQRVTALVSQAESDQSLAPGSVSLIAQIEDVRALTKLDEIACASKTLLGMSLGSEDFSASVGMQPTPEALYQPNQMVVFACRRANILPFGFPSSIADYSDEAAFRGSVKKAMEMGFVGAFCIHPSQARILNEGFSPSAEAIADAEDLLAALVTAEAEGRGAFSFKGKMIDPPVISRAQELLRRAAGLNKDR